MPEVAGAILEAGAVVLTIAGSGVIAKRASGVLDSIVSWAPTTGALNLVTPIGTDAGGGTRYVQLFGGARIIAVKNEHYADLLTLEGAPTTVLQIVLGTTSTNAAFGTIYSGGDVYMSHNARQTAYNTNSWTQAYAPAPSFLLAAGGVAQGLAFYRAAAGVAAGGIGAFWGGALFQVSQTGSITIPGAFLSTSLGGALAQFALSWDATLGAVLQSFQSKALNLNPSGNSVVIGVNPGGTELLRLGGNVRIGGSGNPYVQLADGTYITYFEMGAGQARVVHNGNILWTGHPITGYVQLPNGVIVGADPGGTDILRVGGGVRATSFAVTLTVGGFYVGSSLVLSASTAYTFLYAGGRDAMLLGVIDLSNYYNGAVHYFRNETSAVVYGQLDASATATHTSLALRCVDIGGLARVRTGPAGSGPGGSGRALFI